MPYENIQNNNQAFIPFHKHKHNVTHLVIHFLINSHFKHNIALME